ncbi:putative methyltransferase NSUN7 isoform X2 [Platichthys flesus]|uniref:putative methyltransferase NSUN7 isoform X2 n=1 Tax=Platichthys flesus TaxID=8260 RepID=UPI002DBF9467|nr:putative methyltransferase NSUN7 isoform X2 [Platichthys flesus]
MVKKKKNSGRSSRSSTCKTKRADSQIASSKDPAPLDSPAHRDVPAVPPQLQTPDQGQVGFSDRVYLLASAIFQNHHLEKSAAHRLVSYGKERGIPLPEVKDWEMQHSAYELAFNTLKYQELLEDIMIDSCFHLTQLIPDDQMGLVAVMLFDFQDRKFLPRERQREDEVIQEVREVENYLLRLKTKLAASLARCRIKLNLLSIECFLPESVKMKQQRSSSLPLFTWVNTLKTSLDEVRTELESLGLSQVKSIRQLEGQTFCRDPHCADGLVFPAQLRPQLYSTELLRHHKLVIQDKSCCLGPNAACAVLPEEGDVLMAGCFSGLTVSHTASLIAEKHKANNSNNQPTVYVCVSNCTDAQMEDLQQIVSAMGCKNVKLMPVVFQSVGAADKQLQKVRVILLTPRCSVSAVNNPIEIILQENGDTDLLQDLSHCSIAPSKLKALVAKQREDIGHALKSENEGVVRGALEEARAHSEQSGKPKQVNFRLSPTPFSSPDNPDSPEKKDPFFTLEVSDQSNGCFLALVTREPEPVVKEAPQDVLARAKAKGILDRIGSKQPTSKEHRRNTGRTTKAVHASTCQPRPLSDSVPSRNQETKGINRTALSGPQELTNRRQASQVKPKALLLQTLKSTVSSPFSSSSQDGSSSSSCKPEDRTTPRSTNTAFSTTTSTLHPAPPPSAPVVRPRRALQEVLKPMLFVLPPVHFPNFVAHQTSRAGLRPSFSFNRWRMPAPILPLPRSNGGFSKDTMAKSPPLF